MDRDPDLGRSPTGSPPTRERGTTARIGSTTCPCPRGATAAANARGRARRLGPASAGDRHPEAANDFLSILAYVLGLLGAVPLLLSRDRTVRYHALQSIGIDVLTLAYLVAGTVVGVTWSIIRYGTDPMPNSDPVLNAFVGGIFVVELLPRFYCVLQVLRNRPARVPWVWRMAATLAARRRPPPRPRHRVPGASARHHDRWRTYDPCANCGDPLSHRWAEFCTVACLIEKKLAQTSAHLSRNPFLPADVVRLGLLDVLLAQDRSGIVTDFVASTCPASIWDTASTIKSAQRRAARFYRP